MPANTDQQPSVYISYQKTNPDEIFSITCNAEKAKRNDEVLGFPSFRTTPMLAAATLYQSPNLYNLIDTDTWETVAQGFDELSSKGIINENATPHDRQPVVHETPADLPLKAAQARFRLIQDFQNPANLPRQKELTEILMASKEGRPVNPDLFSEESRKQPTWSQQVSSAQPGDFLQRQKYLIRLYEQVSKSNESILASEKPLPIENAMQ